MANKSNAEFNNKIGRMLQFARESHKVSQIEMAKAVGLTNEALRRSEGGFDFLREHEEYAGHHCHGD